MRKTRRVTLLTVLRHLNQRRIFANQTVNRKEFGTCQVHDALKRYLCQQCKDLF